MKKGFTLVELVGVVALLAALLLLIAPTVDKILKDGKNEMYENQITGIKQSMATWALNNKPDNGEVIYITLSQLKKEGLGSQYTEHKLGVYPENSAGVPFTASYFAVTGDFLADISEDMAAEEKARATYENLMDLTDDPDILAPLSFLRQREIVHFERFKRLYEMYSKKYKKK